MTIPTMSVFTEASTIYSYSRALAFQEEELFDVSAMAREAGISFPVAITAALHADIADIPEDQPCQSYDGRLWDVLWMFRAAIKGRIPSQGDDQCRIYGLIMHVGDQEEYQVKAICGPGDDAEPVITLMKTDED